MDKSSTIRDSPSFKLHLLEGGDQQQLHHVVENVVEDMAEDMAEDVVETMEHPAKIILKMLM